MSLSPRTVTPAYAVDGQLLPSDFAQAHALGFRSIINHRPDGEEAGQPTSQQLELAAQAAGLRYLHIPVAGPIDAAQRQAMQHAMATLPQPVLAFCRSGARSTRIWAQAMQGQLAEDAILAAAAHAGCDVVALHAELQLMKANPHE